MARMRMLPIVLALMLAVPALAAAAVTPDEFSWSQIVNDPRDQATSPVDFSGMDIRNLYHTYDSVNDWHYFRMELFGDPDGAADYYGFYVNKEGVPTGRKGFADYDYYIGFTGDWSLDTEGTGITVLDSGHDGFNLEWKVQLPDLGSGYAWWGITQNNTYLVSDFAIAPIPGAAWLLGSGLVGLIGLRRRKVLKAGALAALLLVSCVFLAAPEGAEAAVTYPDGFKWTQTVTDEKDLADSLAGMDIHYARHTFDGTYHYFQIEMYGDVAGGADYYGIYSSPDAVDTTGRNWFWDSDTYAGFDSGWGLDMENVTSIETDHSGNLLDWKVQIPGLGSDFTWWAVTQKNGYPMIIDYAIAPIPGAAWLLISGLVGLVGLSRRSRKTA